jgi:hypothetical protein
MAGLPSRIKREALDFLPVFAVVVPFLLLMRGFPVPYGNELYYLPCLKRAWDPQYLLNDWIFSLDSPEHKVFNFLFGWPTLFLPLNVVGWGGRLLAWTLNLHALFRISRRLEIPKALAAVSLILWIALGQSQVSWEWVLGGFEAKCIAYALLFYALDRFLARAPRTGGVLLGFAFSMHPAVGLWGGTAMLLALPFCGYKLRELAWVAGLGALCALPEAAPLLNLMIHGHGDTAAMWRFLALVKMPFHFDPMTWEKKSLLTLYLELAFCALYFRAHRAHPANRLVFLFMAASGAVFLLGVAARATESFGVLKLMPFRVFAVTCPLFFLFTLARAFSEAGVKMPRAAALVGLLAVMGMGNPVGKLMYYVSGHRAERALPPDAYLAAMRWLGANTPNGSLVLAPPYRRESWYYSQRGLVVNFYFNPYDSLPQWVERLTPLAGDFLHVPDTAQPMAMEAAYRAVTSETAAAEASRYHASYLVSETRYPFPLLHEEGPWMIYKVGEGGAAGGAEGPAAAARARD